jgi:hypothetical protein
VEPHLFDAAPALIPGRENDVAPKHCSLQRTIKKFRPFVHVTNFYFFNTVCNIINEQKCPRPENVEANKLFYF